MRYRLYKKSERAWDAIMAEMEKAQKSIYLETYIFDPKAMENHDFLGLLKRKAENGLRVIVVADSFGSPNLKKYTPDLQKSGVEILFFSHWLRHIHRKIYIIDEKTAFIGGVNIGRRFKNWNDMQLKLGGKKLIQRLMKSFSYSYGMAGGKNPEILELRKRKISYKLKFWLVEHWPQRNVHTLRRTYEEKISKAQKTVKIVTPYFAPPRWLISLLDDAVKRNVTVEVLVPEKTDLFFADRVNICYMEELFPLGIEFLLAKEMNHSKVLVIDEGEALIGSHNLDIVSFKVNVEAGISFREKRLIADLIKTINDWKKDAEKFSPRKNGKKLIDYLIIALMKIFKPIL